jgi:hypothetical protein
MAAVDPKLTGWVEENIDETLTFYRLPRQHHKHLKSTNMLERLNEEIKRRTHVVRIFPNAESCLRLIRALAVETHENWLEQHRYLNMDDLREHKKRRCAVLPDLRPVQPSTALTWSRTLRAGSPGACAILDCRCARRSARGQVGAKGWC